MGQNIHVSLAAKQSGCIVWVYFDKNNLDLGPFLFFGGKAGEPLPDLGDLKIVENSGKLCNSLILGEATFCKSLILLGAKKFSRVFKKLQNTPKVMQMVSKQKDQILRTINKGSFTSYKTIEDLYHVLFQ